MKILGIAILMMGLLMGFSLSLDILQGFDIRASLQNTLNPFRVMEVAEYIVIFVLVFAIVIESALSFYHKRNAKTNKSEKQS